MNKPLLCILMFAMLAAYPAHAEIYKWTDADGNVHFGTQPPPEVIQGAEDTGIRSQGGSRTSLEGALPGSVWLGRSGNQLIKIDFKENGRSFIWKEESIAENGSRSRPRTRYGDYRVEGERLVLTRTDKNRERLGEETFLARLSGADSLKLVDIHVSGRVYQLSARPTSTRALTNDKEQALAGTWTQVTYRMEDNIVGYMHFGNGIFRLYDPREYGNRIGGEPRDEDLVASGKWHADGSTLSLDFWEAEGSAASRMLRQERWDIVVLDHRRLEITESNGRRTQVFLRQRSQ